MKAKKTTYLKAVVLTLAVVLLMLCTIAGTLAWLTTKTDPITNTFTAGNIDITLTETWNADTDTTAGNDAWVGKLIPGTELAKDPAVTVEGGSEACWLFVKVTEADGVTLSSSKTDDTYVTYDMAAGWTLVPGQTSVYYREVASSAGDQEFGVIADNKVAVPDSVTKAMLDAVEEGDVAPSLTFTAYAVQKTGFASAQAAWTEAQKLDSVTP